MDPIIIVSHAFENVFRNKKPWDSAKIYCIGTKCCLTFINYLESGFSLEVAKFVDLSQDGKNLIAAKNSRRVSPNLVNSQQKLNFSISK